MSNVESLFQEVVKKHVPKAKLFHPYGIPTSYVIDLPSNAKVHGSSISLDCARPPPYCEAEIHLVVHPDIAPEMSQELEKLNGCKLKAVHAHERLLREHHLHMTCPGLSPSEVRKLLETTRWF